MNYIIYNIESEMFLDRSIRELDNNIPNINKLFDESDKEFLLIALERGIGTELVRAIRLMLDDGLILVPCIINTNNETYEMFFCEGIKLKEYRKYETI